MTGIGTLINTACVAGGGLAGLTVGHFFAKKQQDSLSMACGISVLFIGIAGAMEGMLQVALTSGTQNTAAVQEKIGTAAEAAVTASGGVPFTAAITSGRSMFIVLCLALGTVIGELIGADAPGRIGTKELIEIDLFATENAHHFRRNIQVSPLIIVHLVGTGQAVHAERRENKDLIRLEGEELIVHAHKFSTMQVNIQFIIVMTMILGDLHAVTVLIVCFVALLRLLHGSKRGQDLIRLH